MPEVRLEPNAPTWTSSSATPTPKEWRSTTRPPMHSPQFATLAVEPPEPVAPVDPVEPVAPVEPTRPHETDPRTAEPADLGAHATPVSVTLAEAPRTTLEGQQVIGITGNFPQDGTIGGPRPSTSRTQAPAPSPDRLRRKRRPRHHHPDALGRAALAHATSEFDARQQPQRLTPAAVTSTLTELRVRELSTVACRAEQQRLALGSGGFQLDPRGAFSG